MKPSAPESQPIPEWLLERLARGELPAAQAAELRARLAAQGDPGGALHLGRLSDSNEQILAQHPPGEVADEIRRRLIRANTAAATSAGPRRLDVTSRRSFFLLGGLATGAAALAAVLLVSIPARRPGTSASAPGGFPLPGEQGEITTIKGLDPQLTIHRKQRGDAGSASERLPANGSVRAGDTLQISYVSGGRAFGVVASVDSRGTVTLHLPETHGQAARLAPRGETALPHAFKLDATPGFERFVLVTSDEPFATTAVSETLRPDSGQRLPARFDIVETTLYKDMP